MRLLELLFIFVIHSSSHVSAYIDGVQFKKFRKPCFIGDEIENTCSDPDDSCHEQLGTELKLVKIDGVKVNYILF